MKPTKLLAAILALCLMLVVFVACDLGEKNNSENHTNFNGKAGENITWSFDSDNVLTFSGTGDMYEYYTGSSYQPSTVTIPWHAIAPMVEKVVISEGITSICNFAFMGCINCNSFEIPKSIMNIGECAFQLTGVESIDFLIGIKTNITDYMFKECFWLGEVNIPQGVESIGEGAFYKGSEHLYEGGKKIQVVYIPISVKFISASAFSGNSNIEFFVEATSAPEGWETGWNNGSDNIHWGYPMN